MTVHKTCDIELRLTDKVVVVITPLKDGVQPYYDPLGFAIRYAFPVPENDAELAYWSRDWVSWLSMLIAEQHAAECGAIADAVRENPSGIKVAT